MICFFVEYEDQFFYNRRVFVYILILYIHTGTYMYYSNPATKRKYRFFQR